MFATTRFSSVVTALLLTFFSASAMADEAAKVDHVLACSKPSYDDRSIINDEEGIVKLALLVGADGKVVDAKLLASSGYSNLDKASIRAVQGCSVKPSIPEAPASSWANVSFNWILN
ncbi:MAG: energy transducer TonB [Undibacterium sp.]|nr:energy transducer TonB [Undibacterium sp.]